MQIKSKVFSLAIMAAAGLLLGGNVSAAGNTMSSISINDASALIRQIQQKASDLAAQLQISQNQSASALIASAPILSQAKLDNIQTQINVIDAKVTKLKIEVAVYVTLRDIQQKTAQLNREMAGANEQGYAEIMGQGDALPKAGNIGSGTVEAQIAKIKQQISELNQELAAQRASGQSEIVIAPAENGQGTCSGQSCPTGQIQNGSTASAATATPPAAEKKGFWQSVGDFFKNLFTF